MFFLSSEANFFEEYFIKKQLSIYFLNYNDFIFLNELPHLSSLKAHSNVSFKNDSLSFFINHAENCKSFVNLENVQTIYHYSVPNTKLFYPEPFIASASFMHSDLWFVHILVYQYWLWFVFIFIIVFFLITFLCIVRWCNMRVRPRRETRGVSRSKCGDLITAIVPVSWAASIIISESTDAIDYFDGFGTTEIVIGIRAYQWGWEYYYPKDIDLNYNVRKNYSMFAGNSLKYNKTSEVNSAAGNVWKFYQNKPYDFVVTPAHLLLLPVDNYKILNFLNFSDIGTNVFNESALFKQTRMFSKIFHAPLFFVPNDFSLKYKVLSPLFETDNNFFDSYLYGLKRQHNFVSTKAVTNNFSTLFNLKNVEKFLNYNYSLNSKLNQTFTGSLSLRLFSNNKIRNNPNVWLLNNTISNVNSNEFYSKFNRFLIYPSVFESINNNSDKKKMKHSVLKVFSFPTKKQKLSTLNFFRNNNLFNCELVSTSTFAGQFFSNARLTKKALLVFSPNQSVSKFDQTVRKFANVSITAGNLNLSPDINTPVAYLKHFNQNLNTTPGVLNNMKNTKWADLGSTNKLISNRLYLDSPTPVTTSNNPMVSLLNYDNYKSVFNENVSAGFQDRDELMPNYLTRIYWNLFFAHTNVTWRLDNAIKYNQLHNSFYLPLFTFGYDYDFRNWQGLSLLEDAYWETVNSSYFVDEYASLASEFGDFSFYGKIKRSFNSEDRILFPQDDVSEEPFFNDLDSHGSFYSNFIFAEESISTSLLMPTWNFSIFSSAANASLVDDSYDSLKNLNYLLHHSSKIFLNYSSVSLPPYSHAFVNDSFRSDIEDFSWSVDENPITTNTPLKNLPLTDVFALYLTSWNAWFTNYSWDYRFNPEISNLLALPYEKFEYDGSFKDESHVLNFSKTLRFSNYLVLRAPSRSAIGNYNSYQKVFKSRFDENRSHAKATDFANLYVKQPNISAPKPRYERLLGKNKESFFQTHMYKNELITNFNSLYDSFNSINYYFFDLPFLLALKSDASRYLWFDWFAKWGMFEVQPSSASKYSISGVPFFNKNFDFNSESNSQFVDTENYFIRIARARKNYLPSWVYTPYFYAHNSSWYKNNILFNLLGNPTKSLSSLEATLDLMSWYWKKLFFINFHNYLFSVSNSNINSFARSSWKPVSPVAAYYYQTSVLIDILTKREYLYRQFLFSKKKIINLPLSAVNNPNNPLIHDIKAAFMLVDPTTYNNEYSRDVYYNTLTYFHFNVLQSSLTTALSTMSVPSYLTAAMRFFFSSALPVSTTSNTELLKSQYRPMRKGITNMIRLHGTGAVAMPIEIRLQILASSKDVIHSWSIPSAGIKIDCVPGYTSHRVMIFLVSGIFWGQCMEVCGRYHHWMPIIVYFMKRDLFFLWCTHFVFVSGSNNMWTINDRQFTNYVRLASFSKDGWAAELK